MVKFKHRKFNKFYNYALKFKNIKSYMLKVVQCPFGIISILKNLKTNLLISLYFIKYDKVTFKVNGYIFLLKLRIQKKSQSFFRSSGHHVFTLEKYYVSLKWLALYFMQKSFSRMSSFQFIFETLQWSENDSNTFSSTLFSIIQSTPQGRYRPVLVL